MDGQTIGLAVEAVVPAMNVDGLLLILFTLFICLSAFLLLLIARGYSFGDLRVLGSHGSSSIAPPMMPVQPISQVYNPFSLTLVNSGRATLTDGVTVRLTSHTPCWLGVYAGVDIAQVYPIIHSSWSSLVDQISVRNSLRLISQYQRDIDILEEVENKEIQLQFPDIHLGAPPRSCYPLVVFLLDTAMLDSTPAVLDQIVFMVTLFHLKDEVCPAGSHVISQFVRTPFGRPYDLKQLYVTGTDASQPGSQDRSHDSNKASASESVVDNETPQQLPSGDGQTCCIVCQSCPVQRALLPCRHACICNDCCPRLLNCPLCRAFIVSSFDFDADS